MKNPTICTVFIKDLPWVSRGTDIESRAIPHTTDGHPSSVDICTKITAWFLTKGVSINAILSTKNSSPKKVFVSELLIFIFSLFRIKEMNEISKKILEKNINNPEHP